MTWPSSKLGKHVLRIQDGRCQAGIVLLPQPWAPPLQICSDTHTAKVLLPASVRSSLQQALASYSAPCPSEDGARGSGAACGPVTVNGDHTVRVLTTSWAFLPRERRSAIPSVRLVDNCFSSLSCKAIASSSPFSETTLCPASRQENQCGG